MPSLGDSYFQSKESWYNPKNSLACSCGGTCGGTYVERKGFQTQVADKAPLGSNELLIIQNTV